MNNWVHLHQFFAGAVSAATVGWVFSAIVKSMPELPANSGWWTKWIYAALHAVAANLPQSKAAVTNGH